MISPKDDRSAWLTPGKGRPPLHARLLYYQLEVDEFALLCAALEASSDGSKIQAGTKTLAWLSNLEEKQVQRTINGSRDRRKGRVEKIGLVKKGILILTDRENRALGIPATYQFNEAACQKKPALVRDAASQTMLPRDTQMSHGPCDKKTPLRDAASEFNDAASQLRDAASPDSRAFDSKADSRARERPEKTAPAALTHSNDVRRVNGNSAPDDEAEHLIPLTINGAEAMRAQMLADGIPVCHADGCCNSIRDNSRGYCHNHRSLRPPYVQKPAGGASPNEIPGSASIAQLCVAPPAKDSLKKKPTSEPYIPTAAETAVILQQHWQRYNGGRKA
jgi:hypothetical protein